VDRAGTLKMHVHQMLFMHCNAQFPRFFVCFFFLPGAADELSKSL
jgi:hypothetical protein